MDKIVGSVSKPPKARRDDDLSDRLSSRYTVMLLVVFAIAISLTQWMGKPIVCWVPKHFSGSWTKYANSFCWVNNTYYLPFHEYIPREHEDRHTITYYQWIPWILLSQAFFFWAPSALWHGFNSKGGIDSDDILQAACTLQSTKLAEKREARINIIGQQIDRFLRSRKDDGNACPCCKQDCGKACTAGGRRMSSYLVVLYLLSKVAYLVNSICQMFVLGSLLNTDYENFGPEYFQTYGPNQTYTGEFVNSIIFPRITMCDFNVRILGNVQRYTVQCTLPLNLYLEKMYLFFWFWLIFLVAITALDLIIWFLRMVIRPDRRNFVKNHLYAGNYITAERSHYMVNEFVDEYLRQDGAFLLRMIAHNTNTVTTSDITGHLWNMWNERNLNEVSIEDGTEIEDEKIDPAMSEIEPNSDEIPLMPNAPPSDSMEKIPIPIDIPDNQYDDQKPMPI